MPRRISLLPYLSNVRVTILSNVRWFLQHVEEKEEDSEAERFLLAIEDYCQKLISDPSKREKTCPGKGQTGERVRTSHGPVPGRNRPGSGRSRKVVAAK